MRLQFVLKAFKFSGLLAFFLGNLFFFQNCSQPFETLESSSTLESNAMNTPNLKPPRIGDYYAYGDMLINAHDLEKINEEMINTPTHLNSISIGTNGNNLWPGGVIPIRVITDAPNDFTADEMELFRQAVFATCEAWAQEVNITCVPHTQQYTYLEAMLTKNIEKYCGSFAGACASYPTSSGIRRLYAYNPSDEITGTMVHEFGHSLGLMHEHQHNDMDQYYNYPSTDPTKITFGYFVLPFKYSKYHSQLGLNPTFNTEYEPQSVMHYRSLEKYGIVPKPGFDHLPILSKNGAAQLKTTGNTTVPSKGKSLLTVNDILGAQKIYGAKTGAKPTCLHPKTGLPYFFENTVKGFFDKKTVSKNGEKCNFENRVCINGQLSGAFTEPICGEVCAIANDAVLLKGETKTVYIKKSTNSDPASDQWEQFEATCLRAGYMSLKDLTGNTKKTGKLENIHLSIAPAIVPKTYAWNVTASGSCSASPSYSYGSWSTCASNSTQTRSAQCVNTSGSQLRLVTCKDSTGKFVADSYCAGQTKPSTSVSCTASCTGSPVTSQTCTYKPPVTYAWNVTASGSCSASPSYSYGNWSTCASNSTQTRSAQCVNTSGSQLRLVTCRDSTGKFVADSYCAGQTKPTTSVSCTASCTGSPVTSQTCTYKPPVTDVKLRACIPKNLTYYQSLNANSTTQEHTLINPLKITDGKIIQHFTRNTSGSGNIVTIQKNGHYSLVTLKNNSGAATVPSSIVLEGNAEDYQLNRGSTDNMITLAHKSCGEVMRFNPQGSGSMTMFISFKNCTARLNHSWTQQGTIWQFIGGDKIPPNAAKIISGCTPHSEISPTPGLHLKHFGW